MLLIKIAFCRYLFATANDLRDDYTSFFHTFDAAARKHYKVKANEVILFYAEKFFTKHEPRLRTFQLTVS